MPPQRPRRRRAPASQHTSFECSPAHAAHPSPATPSRQDVRQLLHALRAAALQALREELRHAALQRVGARLPRPRLARRLQRGRRAAARRRVHHAAAQVGRRRGVRCGDGERGRKSCTQQRCQACRHRATQPAAPLVCCCPPASPPRTTANDRRCHPNANAARPVDRVVSAYEFAVDVAARQVPPRLLAASARSCATLPVAAAAAARVSDLLKPARSHPPPRPCPCPCPRPRRCTSPTGRPASWGARRRTGWARSRCGPGRRSSPGSAATCARG